MVIKGKKVNSGKVGAVVPGLAKIDSKSLSVED